MEHIADPQLQSVSSRSLLFDKAQVLALANWWTRDQAPGTTVTEEGVKTWVQGGDSRDTARSEKYQLSTLQSQEQSLQGQSWTRVS